MRCDQFAGLPKAAINFLTENQPELECCPTCKRSLPADITQYDTYDGMFGVPLPLFEYTLKDGRVARDVHQASPWSSGPVHFLRLQVSDGTVFEWTEEEMNECL